MSNIITIYEKISLLLNADKSLEHQVYTELARLVSNAHTQEMKSDEGFCFKFNLPLTSVQKLYKTLNLDPKIVFSAFEKDWGSMAMKNRMYQDSYYQLLLVLYLYGKKENKKRISENALLILLFKIWNGRKSKFLKFCDKKIMKYVTSHMLTNRHLFAKYDSPLSMLRDYYVSTLDTKYGPEIIRDPAQSTQRLLAQAWGRVNQQFIQNMKVDIKTGEKKALSGILPIYMKAKQEGLSISSPSINPMSHEDERSPSFSDFSTVSSFDEWINSTTDFITMNSTPKYSDQIIKIINTKTRVSTKAIGTILKSIHNHNFYNTVHELIGLILSRTNVRDKIDVCSQDYLTKVQKTVISSKNNSDIKKIQTLVNELLESIFTNVLKQNFRSFSNVQQIQLRNVIIHGLVYNLRKNICSSGSISSM